MKVENDLTIIIKTFEREICLNLLLVSLRANFQANNYNFPIIIVDDSFTNYKKSILKKFKDLTIHYVVADEPNIGLSAGRNLAVSHVQTAYTMLCDDDVIFPKTLDLVEWKHLLVKEDLDILGSNYINAFDCDLEYLPLSFSLKGLKHLYKNIRFFFMNLNQKRRCYKRAQKFINNSYDSNLKEESLTGFFEKKKDNHKLEILLKSSLITNPKEEEITISHISQNHFIAKTKSLINFWDPDLKIGEHLLVFYDAFCRNIKIGVVGKFKVYNFSIRTSFYNRFRFSKINYERIGLGKREISVFEVSRLMKGATAYFMITREKETLHSFLSREFKENQWEEDKITYLEGFYSAVFSVLLS